MRGYTVAEAMQQTIDEALTPASAKNRAGGRGAGHLERKRTESGIADCRHCLPVARLGVIVTDAQAILRVNPAFSQISGYAPARSSVKTPRMLRSDRARQISTSALWTSIETTGVYGTASSGADARTARCSPSRSPSLPVEGWQSGQVTHYVAVLRDITGASGWSRSQPSGVFDALDAIAQPAVVQ